MMVLCGMNSNSRSEQLAVEPGFANNIFEHINLR